jgi:ketosteroid isomerase-like protein
MNISNQQIIEQMFNNYAAGNMAAVLSCFDKDIIWERPGAPFIPFSGIFKGIEEVTKMFAVQAITINNDTVVVLGHDVAYVIETGKTYSTDWVQAYIFKDEKIIEVQVYLDTKAIADAFVS